jgi:hypothetical protein
MIIARPKYPTDLHGTIYIDNIQKAVVICLIILTTFPFDAGSRVDNVPCKLETVKKQVYTPHSHKTRVNNVRHTSGYIFFSKTL